MSSKRGRGRGKQKSALGARMMKEVRGRGGSGSRGRGGRGRGRGRGRGLGRGSSMDWDDEFEEYGGAKQRRDARDAKASAFRFVITGLPERCSLKEVLDFLKEESLVPLKFVEATIHKGGGRGNARGRGRGGGRGGRGGGNAQHKGSSVSVTVGSQAEKTALSKLSKKQFKGKKIYFKQVTVKGDSNRLESTLTHILQTRFDAENGILDLSSLRDYMPAGVRADLNQNSTMIALFKVIKEQCPTVTSINFSDNRLRTLFAFQHLTKSAPDVRALSFENNLIDDFKQLDYLAQMPLRELVLTNNPIAMHATYRNEVQKRFAKISVLDTQEVEPLIQFGSALSSSVATATLPPVRGSFLENDETAAAATELLQAYFARYDTNRSELDRVYLDSSVFSLTLDAGAVDEEATAKVYAEVAGDGGVASKICGRIHILHALLKLPATRHLLDNANVDAFVNAPGLLSVKVNGTFVERGVQANDTFHTSVVRSFVRSMLVTTAPPASAEQGWSFVILNDHLHLLKGSNANFNAAAVYGSEFGGGSAAVALPAFAAQSSALPAFSTSTSTSTTTFNDADAFARTPAFSLGFSTFPSSAQNTMDVERQAELVAKLQRVTSMRVEYCSDCLEANDWNYEKAIQNFKELRRDGLLPNDVLLS